MKTVFTNGCFDVLHAGHVRCLQAARALGDYLVVGINSDGSMRRLKGPARPINGSADRAELLLALRCVDEVRVFTDERCDKLIREVCPNIYVKGGDYTIETLDPGERQALLDVGAEIHFIPLHPCRSTAKIIEELKKS